MFKILATSVKTAIHNSKQPQQQQHQQQLDDSQITNGRTVNAIRDRNKAEKEFDRKNQRSKLVNENRLNQNAASAPTTDGTMKKANSYMNLSKCNYSMRDQGTDRRKILEEWRLKKTGSVKDTQRPVFKVQHLTSRFFDSKSMSDLNSNENVFFFIFFFPS